MSISIQQALYPAYQLIRSAVTCARSQITPHVTPRVAQCVRMLHQSRSVRNLASATPTLVSYRTAEMTSTSANVFKCTIQSTSKTVDKLEGHFSEEEILKEPCLFSADIEYALKNCGNITKKYLERILQEPGFQQILSAQDLSAYEIVVDVKVLNLKEGEFPTPLGWHTNFAETSWTGEPDLTQKDTRTKNFIVNFSSHPEGVSHTEYLVKQVHLEMPREGVFQSIDMQLRFTQQASPKAVDGEIVQMDQHSLHRATAAHNSGAIGCLRVAIVHKYCHMVRSKSSDARNLAGEVTKNEIRKQMHSYRFLEKTVSPEIMTEYRSLITRTPFPGLNEAFSANQIKAERMITNGSLEFALKNGGTIAQQFLKQLQNHPLVQNAIADGNSDKIKVNIQVHRLCKGQAVGKLSWQTSTAPAEYLWIVTSDHMHGIDKVDFGSSEMFDNQIVYFTNMVPYRHQVAFTSGWRFSLMITVDDQPVENVMTTQSYVYVPQA